MSVIKIFLTLITFIPFDTAPLKMCFSFGLLQTLLSVFPDRHLAPQVLARIALGWVDYSEVHHQVITLLLSCNSTNPYGYHTISHHIGHTIH
jgi:hypothetical protein